jgi:molybdopterin synthase sulfur carrier subunit
MKIRLFGMTRDIVGSSTLLIEPKEGEQPKTVADLKSHLFKGYPELQDLSSLAVAVNQKYAKDGEFIAETDEIALIPPVSGG